MDKPEATLDPSKLMLEDANASASAPLTAESPSKKGESGKPVRKPKGFWVSMDPADTTDEESDSDPSEKATENPPAREDGDGSSVPSEGVSQVQDSLSKVSLSPGIQPESEPTPSTSNGAPIDFNLQLVGNEEETKEAQGHLKKIRSEESVIQTVYEQLRDKSATADLKINEILCKIGMKDFREESEADLTEDLAELKAAQAKTRELMKEQQDKKKEFVEKKMKIILSHNMGAVAKKLGAFQSQPQGEERRRADSQEYESLKRKLAEMEEELQKQEDQFAAQSKKQELEKKNLNERLTAILKEGEEIKNALKAAKINLQASQQSAAKLKESVEKRNRDNAKLQDEVSERLREEKEFLRRLEAAGMPPAPTVDELKLQVEHLRRKYFAIKKSLRNTKNEIRRYKMDCRSSSYPTLLITLQITTVCILIMMIILAWLSFNSEFGN